MFGYVKINSKALSSEELSRYRSHYCGICSRLREKGGAVASLALQYDMAFLSLFLSSIYEPHEEEEKKCCIKHPISGVNTCRSEIVDYAADMCLIMSCFKLEDDVRDEVSFSASAAMRLLEKAYTVACERRKEKADYIRGRLELMSRFELERSSELEELMNLFGDITGCIFDYNPKDYWAKQIIGFGKSLGRYIYLLDAISDRGRDRRRGSYNPLLHREYTDRELAELLGTELACTADRFELIPIVKDMGLLRNIIYSGMSSSIPSELLSQFSEDTVK